MPIILFRNILCSTSIRARKVCMSNNNASFFPALNKANDIKELSVSNSPSNAVLHPCISIFDSLVKTLKLMSEIMNEFLQLAPPKIDIGQILLIYSI